MVSNYKAQFNQMIRDDSYACLMEKMKQRNLQSVWRIAPAVALWSMHAAPQ
jgi:hypothetical protein